MTLPAIEIRPLSDLADFDRCVKIQVAVWGYSTWDVIPRRLFQVASRIGGQVIGALDGETLAGFAMAIPGYRDGRAYLHSHMLAVLPQYRNAGIGKRLKLAQRDEALGRGFDLMEWTFDPLEIRNAALNIARLGAIVRRYEPDLYGPSSSPLQGGLPTDRLYAEWWLRSERVAQALAGQPAVFAVVERVVVPSEVSQWKQDPAQQARAAQLQAEIRSTLRSGFARGLAVLGYERDGEGNGSFLLGRGQRSGEGRGAIGK